MPDLLSHLPYHLIQKKATLQVNKPAKQMAPRDTSMVSFSIQRARQKPETKDVHATREGQAEQNPPRTGAPRARTQAEAAHTPRRRAEGGLAFPGPPSFPRWLQTKGGVHRPQPPQRQQPRRGPSIQSKPVPPTDRPAVRAPARFG